MCESENIVLREVELEGELRLGDLVAPIVVRVSAGADCRLVLDLDPLPLDTSLRFACAVGKTGTIAEEFSLNAKNTEGTVLESDSIFIGGLSSEGGTQRLSVSARRATICFRLAEDDAVPFLRLWLRGFKSFGTTVVNTGLGELGFAGRPRDVGPDDVSGWVGLQANTPDSPPGWREKAEGLLSHVRAGLALAEGGRLQVPLIEYLDGESRELTFNEGEGRPSEMAVIPHFSQRPFVEALVARFERDGALPEILWIALGWMQSGSTIDEIRFLTAMTALETMVMHQLPEGRGTVISKSRYRVLREELCSLVDKHEGLDEEAREVLRGRIKQNNQRSLSKKIEALIDHYDLPRRGYERAAIRKLITLRNEIVHRGVAQSGENLWPHIILVRDLVVHVLLREIGFVGRYESYVGGYETRDFPARSTPA